MSQHLVLNGQLLISGQWRSGAEDLTTRNPSDLNEIVGTYAQATKADAEEALWAARKALPAWKSYNTQARSDILRKTGEALFAHANDIGLLLAREEGKTLRDAVGEVIRAGQIFHYYSGEVVRHPGQFFNSLRDGHSILVSYEPVGVVSLITPWNFPVALPAWKSAAALAYGNTCVLKPSEFAPGCAVRLAQILVESGVPDGVFNLLLGRGPILGEMLVTQADAVSFTGSTPTGRLVLEQAARAMTKVQLELGGKNPLVVLDDADLDNAIHVALQATWGQTGQRCTASERLIVTSGIHDAFVECLAHKVAQLRVGHALDDTTEVGPVATAPQLAKNLDVIEQAKADGAELLVGGRRVEARTPGHYLAPTLFVGTNNAMPLNRGEIFGPVAGVIKVADLDEAIAVSVDCELALSSGICTTSIRSAERFRRASTAGLVTVNTPTAGIEYHVPFGGRAPSGYGGREQGSAAAEFFTESRTTYVNHGVN